MMCNTIKTLFISITVYLTLLGCTSESENQEQAPEPRVTLPTPQVVPVAPSRTTASMSLAGITLRVTMKGTLQPGAENRRVTCRHLGNRS